MQQAGVAGRNESHSVAMLIEQVYAQRLAGSVEGVMSFIADDVEYVVLGEIAGKPLLPCLNGKAALQAHFTGLFQRWVWIDFHINRKIIDGSVAAVEFSVEILHQVSGQKLETTICEVLEFRGGKIVKVHSFIDTFTFIRIAGLAM